MEHISASVFILPLTEDLFYPSMLKLLSKH